MEEILKIIINSGGQRDIKGGKVSILYLRTSERCPSNPQTGRKKKLEIKTERANKK